MITVLALMVAGILIGMFVNKISDWIKYIDKIISVTIYALLFLLGISVGLNDKIMSNLDSIGLDALIISAGAIMGSVLVSWGVYHFFFKNHSAESNEK